MLQRILEVEAMDTTEEAVDYDTMDHSAVNRVFAADFLQVWNGKSPILDLGTGTAQIPIEFCRQSAKGEVIAVDLAEEMLKVAKVNVEKAGFANRISLVKVNARGMEFPAGHFPAVMSNSIIHHIPEPALAFAEIARVAAQGATIFVRDLFRPPDLATINALVDKHAAGATERQRKLFWDSLHAALTVEEVRELVKGIGFDPSKVTQTTDRHWTWAT